MKRYIKSATKTMSLDSAISMLENKLHEVEDTAVNSSSKVCGTEFYGDMTQEEVDELRTYEGVEFPDDESQYQIQETFGSPQAGCSYYNFHEWYEVEDFLHKFPVIQEDINDGYATIVEL